MIYEEAREFIRKADEFGWKLGLETITQLMQRLGNPQDKLRIIHVAGTNGKGSVSAFLSSILAVSGYHVGRYISPSVFSYREKLQIASYSCGIKESYEAAAGRLMPIADKEPDTGRLIPNSYGRSTADNLSAPDAFGQDYGIIEQEYISRDSVARAIELIKPACEAMIKEGYTHPTSFEIETAMAFLYFLWEGVDYVILEVGLGGRLDATNVIKHPLLCVITSISMDHTGFLGDSLRRIAEEKSGIIKEGAPVITCTQDSEAYRVLFKRAKELNTPFYTTASERLTHIKYSLEGTEFSYTSGDKEQRYRISLLGQYQPANAQLAIEAARLLSKEGAAIDEVAIQGGAAIDEVAIQGGAAIDEAVIRRGLYMTRWPGRFELISRKPYIVIDGAHNEAAATVLRRSIEIYFTNHRIIYIIGVLADKDYRSILKITIPLAAAVIAVTPDNSRALPSAELAKEAGVYCDKVHDAHDAAEALTIALREAGSDGVIVAFGSLFYLGSLVSALKLRKDDKDD